MAWAVMTLDYDVRPSDEEITESIDRMLKLFHDNGYRNVNKHEMKDDDINIECYAHNEKPIEKLASCIGGVGWNWIPIAFANSEKVWKNFDGLLDEELDEFDGDIDDFIKPD